MKSKIIIILIAIACVSVPATIYIGRYLWSRAVVSPEHRLQVGSFIFSKQKREKISYPFNYTDYAIFKVLKIDGDLVIVAGVNVEGLAKKEDGDSFVDEAGIYKKFKENIASALVTGVLPEDFSDLSRKALLSKYPGLSKSNYWYEELREYERGGVRPTDRSELSLYVGGAYSAKAIIEERRLRSYSDILTDDGKPDLSPFEGDKIDLIINKK
ncbi:hypothetical protein [Pedobacter nototheniae]|uniref:hypothetical protein n=1 Tax=Pedobacter nototheniae TaxID=2488994 RepID=UPI00292FEF04|nr:hypothetical protein [Pedobacter nototheniae]